MGIYSQSFELAINKVMNYEVGSFWNPNIAGVSDGTNAKACGYTNDPHDPGGETKFGIAKSANPSLDITHLDWAGAKAVYYSHYWLNAKCDRMNGRIAALHFDGAVNNGVGQASKFLQRAIGVLDDGAIGPATLSALATKDPITVCNSICDQREKFYQGIVTAKPDQARYLNGWLRRISEMRTFVTNPNMQF